MRQSLVIRHTSLFPGAGPLQENMTVRCEDGRIVHVGPDTPLGRPSDRGLEPRTRPAGEAKPSGDDVIIDLPGCTLMPGIIQAHAHAGFKQLGGVPLRDFHREYLAACLQAGVTTVRDEGMFLDASLAEVRAARERLDQEGIFPRLCLTGKFLSAPGGYGGMAPLAVASETEAGERVDEVLQNGMDMVKTVLEDGLDPSTRGLPKLTAPLLAAICDAAHRRGARVSAHVTQAHNLRTLVEAGIDDAAHMPFDPLEDDLIRLMIGKRVSVVPTLTVLKLFQEKYGAPVLEGGMANTRRFVEAGGIIGLGDDFIEPEAPWYRLGLPYGEMRLLAEAGLTNGQILTAATAWGARMLGMDHEIGTIEPGKAADLLLVEGNPLEALACLQQPVMAVKAGRIVMNRGVSI